MRLLRELLGTGWKCLLTFLIWYGAIQAARALVGLSPISVFTP
jgi:hypothetical protein